MNSDFISIWFFMQGCFYLYFSSLSSFLCITNKSIFVWLLSFVYAVVCAAVPSYFFNFPLRK